MELFNDNVMGGSSTPEVAVAGEGNVAAQEVDEEPADMSAGVQLSSMVLISFMLCLATLCVAIDNTIISTAVPRIIADFNSIDDVGWYAAIYPLMSSAFQPSYGKIYALFPSKYVFLAALVIFEIGSVICATASDSHIFVLGRAFAGLGSAGIQAGTTLILADCVPLRQRPTWNSIIGSSFAIGSVIGPLLGGVFSDTVTWRWCFYINLPIGGLVMIFIAFFYSVGPRRTRFHQANGLCSHLASFDLAGTLTFVSATMCLLLTLSWGGTTYPWGDARIIALLVLAGVLFCSFIGVERCMEDSSMIPLRILHRRSMIAAIWYGLCLGGVFFVNVFYIPLWFQIVDGVSAVESAILLIPFMLSVVGGFMIAGLGTAASGYYTPFVYASSILMSIGTGCLTTLEPLKTSRAKWIGFQILCGAGIGLGEEQGLYMVQATLAGRDVAIGVGIVLFAQTFGGALFVSVAQAVFFQSITEALRILSPGLDPKSILGNGSTSAASSATSAAELQAAYGTAIKNALQVGLILATVSALGAVLYNWKSLKATNGTSSDPSGNDCELENITEART